MSTERGRAVTRRAIAKDAMMITDESMTTATARGETVVAIASETGNPAIGNGETTVDPESTSGAIQWTSCIVYCGLNEIDDEHFESTTQR
jgi:hypothetical protein